MDQWLLENPLGGVVLGIAAIVAAWKLFWPMLSNFVNASTTSSRTESKTIKQLSEVLDAAIKRAEEERVLRVEVEKERDKLFTRLSLLEAKLEIIQAKLDAYEKVDSRDEYRRSEEHTSELQSLMRISYDVFCLK